MFSEEIHLASPNTSGIVHMSHKSDGACVSTCSVRGVSQTHSQGRVRLKELLGAVGGVLKNGNFNEMMLYCLLKELSVAWCLMSVFKRKVSAHLPG